MLCYVPQLYYRANIKRGINCRITQRTFPPGKKPRIHTHLKQEKENDNPQYDFLPIVQRVHTQEHHNRYATHKGPYFQQNKINKSRILPTMLIPISVIEPS